MTLKTANDYFSGCSDDDDSKSDSKNAPEYWYDEFNRRINSDCFRTSDSKSFSAISPIASNLIVPTVVSDDEDEVFISPSNYSSSTYLNPLPSIKIPNFQSPLHIHSEFKSPIDIPIHVLCESASLQQIHSTEHCHENSQIPEIPRRSSFLKENRPSLQGDEKRDKNRFNDCDINISGLNYRQKCISEPKINIMGLRRAFLNLFVSLFRGYRDFIIVPKRKPSKNNHSNDVSFDGDIMSPFSPLKEVCLRKKSSSTNNTPLNSTLNSISVTQSPPANFDNSAATSAESNDDVDLFDVDGFILNADPAYKV